VVFVVLALPSTFFLRGLLMKCIMFCWLFSLYPLLLFCVGDVLKEASVTWVLLIAVKVCYV
jgi:hypothetical protein